MRRFSPRCRFGIIRAVEGVKIKPRLYILAGANGSGKSTISKVLLPSEGLVYVNPDDISKELSPDRYSRSKYNFVSLYSGMADHWLLYYNGGTDFSLVAHGNGDTNIILKERYETFMEGLCRK